MSRIYMSESQRRRMVEQLEAAYPHEGAGFLFGHLVEGYIAATDVVIDEVIPVDNTSVDEEKHRRFVVRPQDWMRFEDEADERGLTLIGCYHSHPDSPADPSEFDRAHSYPNFLYIIVSVAMGRAGEINCYELSREGSLKHITAVVPDDLWKEIMTRETIR